MDKETEARDCLSALLKIESGLTDWEVEFIEKCNKCTSFSDRQISKIFELYDMFCKEM